MVELVDTLVSGTSFRKDVGVRVPFWVRKYKICADGEIGRHATLRG